jgi:hypothetical protein
VGTYLMECYEPGDAVATALTGDRLIRGREHVRVLWGVFAPDDELSLWLVDAPSRDELTRALADAGIHGHLQEAVPLVPRSTEGEA